MCPALPRRSACDDLVFLTKAHTPKLWGEYCAPGVGVAGVCPNGKALSNISHGKCNKLTGAWECFNKQNSPFDVLPVMVPPAPAI